MKLHDVIPDLKAVARGDKDLTADVYEALGHRVIRTPRSPGGIAWRYFEEGYRRWRAMEDLTTSLDAAKRLVPEGFYWVVGIWRLQPGEPLHVAQILKPGRGALVVVAEAEAADEILALCAAALQARADGHG